MWVMSKYNYRDEDLMNKFIKKLVESSYKPSIASIVKLTQSIAKLDCKSLEIFNYILSNIRKNFDKVNNESLVLLSFYLTMLNVNNDGQFIPQEFIKNIISKIKLEEIVDIKQKVQLTQINAAGFVLKQDKINEWSDQVKNYVQSNAKTSYSQLRVAEEINSIYKKFAKVSLEEWIPQLAASVDILIEYSTGAKLIVEFDSQKYHGYLNDLARDDATTVFHSKIANINNLSMYRIKEDINKYIYLRQIDQYLSFANQQIKQSSIEEPVVLKPLPNESEKLEVITELNLIEKDLIKYNEEMLTNPSTKEIITEAIKLSKKEEKKIKTKPESSIPANNSEAQELAKLIKENQLDKFLELLNKLKQEKTLEQVHFLLNSEVKVKRSRSSVNMLLIKVAIENLLKQENEISKIEILENGFIAASRMQSALNIISHLSSNGVSIPVDYALNDESIKSLIVRICLYTAEESKHIDLFLNCFDLIPNNESKKIFSQYLFYQAASTNNLYLVSFFVDNKININYACPLEFVELFNITVKNHYFESGEKESKLKTEIDRNYIEKFVNRLNTCLFKNNSFEDFLNNSLEEFMKLLNKNNYTLNYFDSRDGTGVTALHAACCCNKNIDVVKFLIKAGAKVNTVTSRGITPMHSLVNNYFEDGCFYVLEHTNPNLRLLHSRSKTPLMLAIINKLNNVAIKIMEKDNGCINVKSNNVNSTALMLASYLGNEELVLKLLENGAQVDIRNAAGGMAPITAATQGHYKLIIPMVIAHGSTNPLRINRRLMIYFTFSSMAKDFIEKYENNPVKAILEASVPPVIKSIGLQKIYEQGKLTYREVMSKITEVTSNCHLTEKEVEKIKEIKYKIKERTMEQIERKSFAREELISKSFANALKEEKTLKSTIGRV
jgi:ankyrin repeat protein